MIENIHDCIRQDLINNRKELFNLHHYYTHKFRSNDRLIDINVGLFRDTSKILIVQIYVADKNTRIREQLLLDNDYNIYDTNTIIKRY